MLSNGMIMGWHRWLLISVQMLSFHAYLPCYCPIILPGSVNYAKIHHSLIFIDNKLYLSNFLGEGIPCLSCCTGGCFRMKYFSFLIKRKNEDSLIPMHFH